MQSMWLKNGETWQMHRPWQELCFAAFELENGHVWQLSIHSDMVGYFATRK